MMTLSSSSSRITYSFEWIDTNSALDDWKAKSLYAAFGSPSNDVCSSPSSVSLLSRSPFLGFSNSKVKRKKTKTSPRRPPGPLASGQSWVFLVSLSHHQVATPTDYLNEFRGRSVLRFVQQRCPLSNVCLFRFPCSVACTTLPLHVKVLVEGGASTHRRCAPTSSQVDQTKKKTTRNRQQCETVFFGGGPHPRAALPSEKKKNKVVEEVKIGEHW